MGLTSAMNTSLNGLSLNETSIDVLGNNISNASTDGFKASSVLFTTQLARTLAVGSRPSGDNAGTNPKQVGLGAASAAISRDFSQGSITTTNNPSDMAIQGKGFFVVKGGDGRRFTRNGNFSLNSDGLLTTASGMAVQGYGVDENFNLVKTQLKDIRIPIGELNIAQETKNLAVKGALLSSGQVATHGSEEQSEALTDTSTGAAATGSSLLTNLKTAVGASPFTSGQTVTLKATKGGRQLDARTFDVTATSTLNDFTTFLDDTLGIHSGGSIPPDGNTGTQPGVTITAGGKIQVVGNMGTANDISLGSGNLTVGDNTVPLSFERLHKADGESALVDFPVYDSLGQQVDLQISAVLESHGSGSSTFRYYVDSGDTAAASTAVSDGTLQFDGKGKITSGGTATFTIDRGKTGADSPMKVTADFSKVVGISSTDAGSVLKQGSQDGAASGSLSSFVVDDRGIVNGVFDNGINRPIGQIALARFSNPQGLLEESAGTFREGVSSGTAAVVTPGTFGAGNIRAGAVELSNTDVGKSLVDLIVASTNYRGNARVISAVQQLVQELLTLNR